jgi:hypothetical protein
VPLDIEFVTDVLGRGFDDEDKKTTLYLKPITDYTDRLKRTLDFQVERYMRIVKPSLHYPAIGSLAFLFLRKLLTAYEQLFSNYSLLTTSLDIR